MNIEISQSYKTRNGKNLTISDAVETSNGVEFIVYDGAVGSSGYVFDAQGTCLQAYAEGPNPNKPDFDLVSLA